MANIIKSADQQHLLFLFLPIKKGTFHHAATTLNHFEKVVSDLSANDNPDVRAATGVHFFLFYGLAADQKPAGMLVPSFQTFPGKDLLVVQAIYDADFAPYIASFVTQDSIAQGLNLILSLADESGIPGVDPEDPTTAVNILANGGVQSNPDAFNCFLMRYNFADPTIPAGGAGKNAKYLFGGTFPGLTVGKILDNYPDAETLWPYPPVTPDFAESFKPQC